MDQQAITAMLYSPATLTKKAPKPASYDPIVHERKEYVYQDGKVLPVSIPTSPLVSSISRHESFPKLPVRRPAPNLTQNWYYGLNSAASPPTYFPKTRVRDEKFDPITGVRTKYSVSPGFLNTLGHAERTIPTQAQFSSPEDLRTAYQVVRESKETIAGARRIPVQSVAYVTPYLMRS